MIYDPEKIYEAQEIGYMPVEVRVFKKNIYIPENIIHDTQTIYHGTHVIGYVYPEKKPYYNFLEKNMSAKIASILHKSNFLYPIIPASNFTTGSEPQTHSVIVFNNVNETQKYVKFLLGHEATHVILGQDPKYKKYDNKLRKKFNSTKHAQEKLNIAKKLQHEEYFCDHHAAFALALTVDKAVEITQQGINFFNARQQRDDNWNKLDGKQHNELIDHSTKTHPSRNNRIQKLEQQREELLKLKQQPDCDYQWQLARKQDAESLYKKFEDFE